VLRRRPDDPSILAQVVSAHEALASTALAVGDTALALAHHRLAYDLQQRLLQLQPGVVETELTVAAVEVNFALANLRTGSEDGRGEARCLFDGAAARLAELQSAGKLAGFEPRCELISRIIAEHRDELGDPDPRIASSDAATAGANPGRPREGD
jgi:hypothetical protein